MSRVHEESFNSWVFLSQHHGYSV
jgi:hypothetical protein